MQEIENGIYYEDAYPGVTLGALVFTNGVTLIDAPLRSEDARAWRNALMDYGSDNNRLLINLDPHPDRTLGARALEATIVSHVKTAQVFRGGPSIFKGQSTESGSEWETYNDTVGTRWALPDITFSQKLSLHFGPPDVELEHHPGPAPGAIWVTVPDSKVIFVGDAVLYNQPPFLAQADIQPWIETLELLKSSFKGYTIVSGRGGPVPFAAVEVQLKLMKNIDKGLDKIAKRGKPAEATESLITGLMKDLSFPPQLEEQYVQRLRHGLSQYYSRRYRPQDLTSQMRSAESDMKTG
jgi:glyoxylase-like metal-dependent hydrolase (beta-lactamase superfamily II)